MVYKVIGNFDDINFELILEKISKYFKFLYQDGSLFLALLKFENKEQAKIELKKILKPAKNFIIKEINEKNIMNEDKFIIDWCRDNLVSIERQKYEIEQQKKLQDTMKALDNFEKILAEQAQKKNEEGRTNIG